MDSQYSKISSKSRIKGLKSSKAKTELRDDPAIRHSYNEQNEVNLNQEHEVRHAREVGAIKVKKDSEGNGEVFAVEGKTHVKDGKLLYDKKGKDKHAKESETKAERKD